MSDLIEAIRKLREGVKEFSREELLEDMAVCIRGMASKTDRGMALKIYSDILLEEIQSRR